MILTPLRGWLRNRIGSHGLRRGLHSLSAPRTDLSVVNAPGVCISGCTFPGGILGFFTEEWLSLRQPLSLGMNSFAPQGLAAQSHRFPRLTPWATFFVRSADRFVSSQRHRGVYQRLYISRRNSWLFYRRMAFPTTAAISGDEFFRPAGAGRAIAFGSHGLRHGLHSCVRFADCVPGGREHSMQVKPAHLC